MRLGAMEQLSVLASATGVALALLWFAGVWVGADTPDWLPSMVAAIGGFELFMSVHERARRRGDGNG